MSLEKKTTRGRLLPAAAALGLFACSSVEAIEDLDSIAFGVDRYCDVEVPGLGEEPITVRVSASTTEESLRGVRLLRARKWAEAMEAFEDAVAGRRDDHRSLFGLGVASEMSGELWKASQSYQKAFFLRRLKPYSEGMKRAGEKHERLGFLAEVDLYAPRAIPAAAIRTELRRIAAASPLWDKKVSQLQVIDFQGDLQHLRATVSAVEPRAIHELQVFVREELQRFVDGLDPADPGETD